MRNIFLILFSVLFLSMYCRAGAEVDFNRYFKLIPAPKKIELLNGRGIMFSDIQNINLTNTSHIPVVSGILEGLPFNDVLKQGTLHLVIDKNLDVPSAEGYLLEVKNGQVVITAKEQSGLFYGIQTLTQLLQDAHDQSVRIPECRITDYPDIACRAVHIDLKSHLDAGNYYYTVIDRLASVKVNTLIIEFEDKLRYRKAKYVGAPNAISIEEFIELSKYAKERNIEISPLVQGLGHASYILKHPEYKELRDDSLSDYVFDPMNPKTYELQFAMYEDAMAATPFGKYLQVGGDEIGKLGKSELSKRSGMKPLELQMYWWKKVTDFAVAHNRIPIFWDDMVFKLADLYQTTYDTSLSKKAVAEIWNKQRPTLDENIALFPKNCLYARWNYETPMAFGNKLAMEWYKSNGLSVMPATAAQEGYLMLERKHSNFNGIRDFCLLTAETKIDKILCTVWDDSSPHLETIWRGIFDFASMSWNSSDNQEDVLHARFRQRFYAPALADKSFEFRDQLEEAVTFWETALLSEGDRENIYPDFKYVEMPDSAGSGEWSKKYASKLEMAGKEVQVYADIKSKIEKSLSLTRRNRYALEVFDEINEVQVYSSKLLLLLHEYDVAKTIAERRGLLVKIKQYVDHFSTIREKFESVYTRTRTLMNPEGYVQDSNARAHWADITENTDWIYYLEVQMNKRIYQWLNKSNKK